MVERLPVNKNLSPKDRAIESLIRRSLRAIDASYGKEGRQPKPYHNLQHTLYVVSAAEHLADAAIDSGRISPEDKQALRLAAAYHDHVHEQGAPDNEENSALVAARNMEMMGLFSQSEVDKVVKLIMATKVKGERRNGGIRQSARVFDYATMLMADADLSAFGSPWEISWQFAQAHFAERHPGQELTGRVLQDFLRKQIKLLGGHRYYTAEALQLFPYQADNVRTMADMLATTGAPS